MTVIKNDAHLDRFFHIKHLPRKQIVKKKLIHGLNMFESYHPAGS